MPLLSLNSLNDMYLISKSFSVSPVLTTTGSPAHGAQRGPGNFEETPPTPGTLNLQNQENTERD